jgi:hypothetical protein
MYESDKLTKEEKYDEKLAYYADKEELTIRKEADDNYNKVAKLLGGFILDFSNENLTCKQDNNLMALLDKALHPAFEDRYTPLVQLIDMAIRREAEAIAKKVYFHDYD